METAASFYRYKCTILPVLVSPLLLWPNREKTRDMENREWKKKSRIISPGFRLLLKAQLFRQKAAGRHFLRLSA